MKNTNEQFNSLLHKVISYYICLVVYVVMIINMYPSGNCAYYIVILSLAVIALYGYLYKKIDSNYRRVTEYVILGIGITWIAAALRKFNSIESKRAAIFGGCFIFAFLIIRICYHKLSNIQMVLKGLAGNWELCLIVIVFIALSLPVVANVPSFDSGAYYGGNIVYLFDAFDFTFTNVRDFFLSKHTTLGYSLLVLIAEMITPEAYNGTYLLNIMLAAYSMVCFYKLLSIEFGDDCKYDKLILTTVYGLSPYMLGLIGLVTIDNPSLYLVTIMMYAFATDNCLSILVWSCIFVNTKEPNVIYYGFFVGMYWLTDLMSKGRKWKSLERLACYITPMVLWLVQYIRIIQLDWGWQKNHGTGGVLHKFGLTVQNTAIKTAQIYLFNFHWILLLITIIVICTTIRQKKLFLTKKDAEILMPVISLMIGTLLFNLFYLDYPHMRYVMVAISPVLLIIAYILIRNRTKYVRYSLAVLCILFLIQAFWPLDPFTNLYYREKSTLTDAAIFNRNCQYYIESLSEVLDAIDYGEGSVIVYDSFSMNPKSYGNTIYWDSNKERLTHYAGNGNIKVVFSKDGIEDMNNYYLYESLNGIISNTIPQTATLVAECNKSNYSLLCYRLNE